MDNIQEDQESARLAMLDMLYETQLQALKQSIMGSPSLAGAGRTGPLGFRSGTSVVAQGDSWFDYLPGNDIIKALKRRGFIIKNYGSGGDTLENMLFGSTYRDGNWGRYPTEHLKVLESLKIIQPKFFLFSGGGNDIAGPELAPYLNHAGLAPDKPLREDYLNFMFRQVFRASYEFMINSVSTAHPGVQIILHGYGHAIPTGKGVVNFGPWRFVGPWLRPSLTAKGILDPRVQAGIIQRMIDVFNEMLAELAGSYPNVHYIDLRKLIVGHDWVNELHLNRAGYEKVGDKYLSLMKSMMTDTQRLELEESQAFVSDFLRGDGSALLNLIH